MVFLHVRHQNNYLPENCIKRMVKNLNINFTLRIGAKPSLALLQSKSKFTVRNYQTNSSYFLSDRNPTNKTF